MTAASAIIDRVVQPFNLSDSVDTLAASVNAGAATITVSNFLPRWGAGTLIQLESEVLLVTAFDNVSGTANVVRGWMGTTAATHASGSPIYITPRVFRIDALNLINNCLIDLYPDLYTVGQQDIVYQGSSIGYELDAGSRVFRVQAELDQSYGYWKDISDYTVQDNLPTSAFATGRAVMIRASMPAGSRISISYEKPFVRLTDEADDLITVAGLTDYMEDLPYYFAMSRVMVGEELERSQSDTAHNHQRAQDVPAFLALRTGEWYLARYNDLKKVARNRLHLETGRRQGTGYGS